ncbi:CHAP domain protein [Streptococcus infantis X]|uniref:CHAP domain protein n=1 Tax=Streptococcus infantis X TaxID=997830 RepID=F9PCH1_9STRE|nr:CHAP domain protein [Streptococcus infantis X]QBX25642.1 lysin [Streptococcus phage Javan266]
MSKTNEMIQFFIEKADAGAGVDYDGMYGYQCADLTCMGVYKFFGARLWGNAIDLLRSAEAAGLQVVYGAQYPKAGWFFVKNFVAGDGVNYGHTGLVYEDSDGSTIKTIEQNIDGNWDYLDVGGPCRYYERSVNSIVGYIVPPQEDQTGWKHDDTGWWWSRKDGSYPTSKFEAINGNWFYFNDNGYMYADQWLHHTDGNWYWFDKDGYMSNSGWKKSMANGTTSMQTVPCRLAGLNTTRNGITWMLKTAI